MPTKHMGNLLVSLQSIATLAQANQSKSLVVVDESYREILESIPTINDILYYPRASLAKANKLGQLRLFKTFYDSLRAYRASLLLNFDSQPISTSIALMSRIKPRWGLSDSPRKRLYTKIVDDNSVNPHRFHHYDQYVRNLLACPSPPQYPKLRVLEKHSDSLRQILQSHNIDADQPYVCIHAGATKDYKLWPAANYARTADWLVSQGYQVIFIGAGSSDRSIIKDINQQSTEAYTNLCDTLSLGQLIALFSRSAFFLGNDSGPMHLATACGAPVTALFGPTDEQRWGPLGSNATVVRDTQACAEVCSKKFCSESFRCIKLLDENSVRLALAEHITGPASNQNHRRKTSMKARALRYDAHSISVSKPSAAHDR
ncbi:MAG: glycosyltransferase family 9 protein [Porticoccaceae bacterium]|nr:glycosyltransferase family 9 protein [Porticoccaceae bacterium]